MEKWLVWVSKPGMIFRQIKSVGVVIEAESLNAARVAFAAAANLGSTSNVQAMSMAEIEAAEARQKKAKLEAALTSNLKGELHNDQLQLKVACGPYNRTVREWVVRCTELEEAFAAINRVNKQ